MIKIWINNLKGEDKIIAFDDSCIYKANPKQDEIDHCIDDLNNGINNENIVSLPYNYIRYIKHREKRNNIVIFHGKDSKYYLRIKSKERVKEIFDSFKNNIPDIYYQFEKYSIFRSAKKQLIGLTVLLLMFFYVISLAVDIQNGTFEELFAHGNVLSVLLYSVANLGVSNVSFIFGALISIVLYSMIRAMINRPLEHKLFFVWKP